MSSYKLTYFNVRGKGELIRLLFATAGQKYEDNRIAMDQWPALKPTMPFGQIPVLEVDGLRFCQSTTIGRFLANRFGLAGKTEMEKIRADMIVDCIYDARAPVGPMRFEPDKTKQAELREKYGKETMPTHINNLEKLLRENNGGDSYFVGDALTWADIYFTDLCSMLESSGFQPDFGSATKLKALRERVESHPKIAEWIKNRPVTDF